MERRQSIMRRRGKTFLSLFLSAVIVTGQPVLAADFSAGEETFISETTEQEGDVSEASAIFEDTVDSDSEMRYEKYEATVSSEILDLGQTGVNGSGWERRWWLARTLSLLTMSFLFLRMLVCDGQTDADRVVFVSVLRY